MGKILSFLPKVIRVVKAVAAVIETLHNELSAGSGTAAPASDDNGNP